MPKFTTKELIIDGIQTFGPTAAFFVLVGAGVYIAIEADGRFDECVLETAGGQTTKTVARRLCNEKYPNAAYQKTEFDHCTTSKVTRAIASGTYNHVTKETVEETVRKIVADAEKACAKDYPLASTSSARKTQDDAEQ